MGDVGVLNLLGPKEHARQRIDEAWSMSLCASSLEAVEVEVVRLAG